MDGWMDGLNRALSRIGNISVIKAAVDVAK